MNCYKDSYLEKPETKTDYAETLLEVEVGTNGYKGGDAGHGSTTYFRIEGDGCACIEVDHDSNGFEVALGGDWELSAIIKAFEFILETLKEQAKIEEPTNLELLHQNRINLSNSLSDLMKEMKGNNKLDEYLKILDRYIEISKLIEKTEKWNEHSQSQRFKES